MRKLFNLALIFVLTLSIVGCSSDSNSTDDQVQSDESVIRIGMEANYTPYNWTQNSDANGAYPISAGGGYAGGYDVEIAKIIADELGKELVIVKSDWEGLTPALNSNMIDLIIAGMSPTEERKESINFSDPYYTSEYVIVVRSDSDYVDSTSLEDFSDAKISAQLNTFNYSLVDQIPNVSKEQAMDSFSSLIVALSSGTIDGYISEVPAAQSAVSSNPDLTYVSFEDGNGFDARDEDASIAVGVSKDNEDLLNQVNDILANISDDQRDQLMEDAIANQPLNN